MNYVEAFKTAPSPFLDLCPHACNKLAYSAMFVPYIHLTGFRLGRFRIVGIGILFYATDTGLLG